MSKLNQDQINSNLSKFAGWSFEKDSISKQFQFKDFIEALSFVNTVGLEAEKWIIIVISLGLPGTKLKLQFHLTVQAE